MADDKCVIKPKGVMIMRRQNNRHGKKSGKRGREVDLSRMLSDGKGQGKELTRARRMDSGLRIR